MAEREAEAQGLKEASGGAVPSPKGREVAYAWVGRTEEVIVFRLDGRLLACSAICPHMGGRLTIDRRAGKVVCPWHGLTFTLPDCHSTHPRYRHLRTYSVTESQGHVRID